MKEIKMTKSRWIGLAFGVLLILAASALVLWQGVTYTNAGTALAQTAPTATPAPQGKSPAAQGTANDLVTAFWNALASKLGISVDTLKSAFADAEKAAIEQAVKDGKLTRAQADKMEQRLNANTPNGFAPFFRGLRGGIGKGGPGKGFGFGFRGGPLGGVSTLEAVANVLNLKPADLTTQLRSGKTLADIAKAQNVDEAKVKQAIIDAAKAQIQQEVQDGVLTQAQADQILSRLTPDKIDLTRTRGFGVWGWW
jgi:membrane-bound lytic murein transglycosylase B